MKILTWNINGVRASKVPLKQLFDSLDADIICLQETKVTRDQLDEKSAVVEGYSSYFSFSRARSGYSGVATYVRDTATPIRAEEGLSGLLASDDEDSNLGYYGDQTEFTEEELQSLDNEGRTVITQHNILTDSGVKPLCVINVYCPRADPEKEERKIFKIQFYRLLQTRAEAILAAGSHVIVLGDINTSHQKIDHCDPGNDQELFSNPGRQWLDHFLWAPYIWQTTMGSQKTISGSQQFKSGSHQTKVDSCQIECSVKDQGSDLANQCKHNAATHRGRFVDSFRYLHPEQECAFTCWSTVTNSRVLNYGTRIDYIFVDKELAEQSLKESSILPEVQGSDHCPVKMTLGLEIVPAKKCPPLCTKYLPEFAGKQQKLLDFWKKKDLLTEERIHGKEGGQDVSSDLTNSATKRTNTIPTKTKSKRPKLEGQSSVTSFFSKSKDKKNLDDGDIPKDNTPSTERVTVVYKEGRVDQESKVQVAGVWKSLLKGPAPAPLCKGHKEACVLRTVKKDSLNKGRQFYVCSKPEGPKANPESRCDHFEWVEKKRKLAKS